MRLLCAFALMFGLCLALSDANKPLSAAPDDSKARTDKLEVLKKKYEETFTELKDRLKNAAPNDRKAIIGEMKEETQLMAGKVLKIVEENPKDDVAFDAVAFILEKGVPFGITGGDYDKALDIVTEHHAANAKVKNILPTVMGSGAAGEKLLKAVSEKATDKEAKATALFIRGFMISRKLDDEEDEKQLALLVKQATDFFEQAKKLAPDTKLGKSNSTIGQYATDEIEGLKAATVIGVGKPAPEVASKLLDGKAVKLSDYKGKVVILDIWATWCGPCRAMIPHERELVEKMKDKPFVLISVSADKEKETLEKFIEKEAMPWVHWWNDGPKSEVLTKYRVKAFPTMYVIDHEGVIKHKWVGNPGNDKIDAAIEELVKAATKPKG